MVPGKRTPHARFPQFGICGVMGWALEHLLVRKDCWVGSLDENKKIIQLPSIDFPVIPSTDNTFSGNFFPGYLFLRPCLKTLFHETFFPETLSGIFFPRDLFTGLFFLGTFFQGIFFRVSKQTLPFLWYHFRSN